jgi:SLA1 Homology Domain 1 (SHD1) protein
MQVFGTRLAALATCLMATTVFSASAVQAREWTDSTGKYKVKAELVDFDDATVVMRRVPDGELLAVPLDRLSKADQDYLESAEDTQSQKAGKKGHHVWTLRDGRRVTGRLLRYGRGTMTIGRSLGKVLVTVTPDDPDTEPPVVQKPVREISDWNLYMILKVVSKQEQGVTVNTLTELESWFTKLKGQTRDYKLQGVVLELENQEQFAVPFFLFSEKDLTYLEPGWKEWSGIDEAYAEEEQIRQAEQQKQSLYLRAREREFQRDQNQQMLVNYLVFGVGQWEVQLIPNPGVAAGPTSVIVPGRNSNDARREAMMRYPNFNVGIIRNVSPR